MLIVEMAFFVFVNVVKYIFHIGELVECIHSTSSPIWNMYFTTLTKTKNAISTISTTLSFIWKFLFIKCRWQPVCFYFYSSVLSMKLPATSCRILAQDSLRLSLVCYTTELRGIRPWEIKFMNSNFYFRKTVGSNSTSIRYITLYNMNILFFTFLCCLYRMFMSLFKKWWYNR